MGEFQFGIDVSLHPLHNPNQLTHVAVVDNPDKNVKTN
jgi:hypothetical protein